VIEMAVGCIVEIARAHTVEDVGTRPDLLPVRVGVHTGPAVMSGCDRYGSAVNLAARLADQQSPTRR
jgi:class 3 adenylate cyclase